jgi:hypothetical protein
MNFRLGSYTLNDQNKLAAAAKLVAGEITKPIQDDPTGRSTLADPLSFRPSQLLRFSSATLLHRSVDWGDGAVLSVPHLPN